MKSILKKMMGADAYGGLSKVYWKIKRTCKKPFKFLVLGVLYPAVYWKASRKPVKKNKILFVEVRLKTISNSLRLLEERLSEAGSYEIREHFLRNGFVSGKQYMRNCLSYIKDAADAEYIFISDSVNVLGRVKLRKETKMIQVWHGCGAFKKFGYSTCELLFGPSRKELDFYPTSNHYDMVTVSSPEVVWAYEEAFGLPKGRVIPTGISRTDVFFNAEFRQKAMERLYRSVPQARGKKILLYAPTFRGRVASAKAPDRLAVKDFCEAFSGEYVLLIKHHPIVRQRPEIPEQCREFAVDVSELLDIDTLLIGADICITDYSSLVFEYSLFERPILFFAYDVEEYCDWRGFYYPYQELAPGPVFKENEEMIRYIRQIGAVFDKERVTKFRKKFMSACDGHATERILERALLKNN